MIAENLKHLREDKDLSRKDFGARLHVSGDVINNWERGRVEIPVSMIKLISFEFSVSESWLRTGEGEMYVQTSADLVEQVAKDYELNSAGRLLLETVLELPDEYAKLLVEVAQRLVKKAGSDYLRASYSEVDIDAEVESYRQALLREKKAAEESSASSATAAREA